jgi:hypothetical protein
MKTFALSLAVCGLLVAACAEKAGVPEPVTPAAKVTLRAVKAAPADALSQAPVLRNRLPSETLAYLRVPNLWALIATAKGSMLDKAVGSEAYVNATKGIREGFAATLLEDTPAEARELLKLLFTHTRSPIEIVPLAPSLAGAPMPNVLIAITVDFADSAELDAFLDGMITTSPAVARLTPTDAAGTGAIRAGGLPLLYHYDAATGRMYIFGGPDARPGALEALLARLKENVSHPMLTQEAATDASGQGLFLWIDAQATLAFLETAGQSQQADAARALGAKELKALAFGIGTRGGTHRAKLIVEMPRTGFRAFAPDVQSDIRFAAAGDIDALALLSLPAAADVTFMENAAIGMMNADTFARYRSLKQRMREELGFGIEDIFAAVGPELIGVIDEAGNYAALRVRDKTRFANILEALNKKYNLERENRQINGLLYHHYVIPTLEAAAMQNAPQPDDTPVSKFVSQYFNAPTHIYWRNDGDYVVLGGVPQALIDRAYVTARTDVKQWLTTQQKVDPSQALLLGTQRSKGMPRFLYDMNLQLLQFLGDYTDRPVDMFTLPTAREAALAQFGAFSFQINSSATDISLELSFENNPAELLFAGGGGFASAALLGVMAAVAIPAYQDYTLRAKVQGGLQEVIPLKEKVTEIFAAKKRFARAKEVAPVLQQIASDYLEHVEYDPNTGEITLYYDLPEMHEYNTITLTPQIADDGLVWSCSGAIENKWLPQECRE